jgi:F0F1-type ATP synthase delta subunit
VKLKLDESVSSRQDLRAVILELRHYASHLAHNAIKKQVSGHSKADNPQLSPSAQGLLEQCLGDNHLTKTALDKAIADLEAFEKSAKQIMITLADAPSQGIKKTLTAWCRTNLESNLLVSFQFNSTLLGGLVVNYGSHIFDWSFRRQILAERRKFPEVLRHV